MNEIRCICINDKNKPPVIPSSHWVIQDNKYTIDFVAYCTINKKTGVGLKELYIPESAKPYEYYDINRFAINKEDLDLFTQLVKECTELDEVDVESLIEQTKFEEV